MTLLSVAHTGSRGRASAQGGIVRVIERGGALELSIVEPGSQVAAATAILTPEQRAMLAAVVAPPAARLAIW